MPADAGRERGEHEGERPDPRKAHAGPPGGLGVAADGVDVAAEPRPAEHERPERQDPEDDQHDPRHAADRHEKAAIRVADQQHHHRGGQDPPDLDLAPRVRPVGGATRP